METLLTARSRRCLALVESRTGLVVTALAWKVGITFIPISSRFQSWDDCMALTHFINKSESTYEVVVRELLGADIDELHVARF